MTNKYLKAVSNFAKDFSGKDTNYLRSVRNYNKSGLGELKQNPHATFKDINRAKSRLSHSEELYSKAKKDTFIARAIVGTGVVGTGVGVNNYLNKSAEIVGSTKPYVSRPNTNNIKRGGEIGSAVGGLLLGGLRAYSFGIPRGTGIKEILKGTGILTAATVGATGGNFIGSYIGSKIGRSKQRVNKYLNKSAAMFSLGKVNTGGVTDREMPKLDGPGYAPSLKHSEGGVLGGSTSSLFGKPRTPFKAQMPIKTIALKI